MVTQHNNVMFFLIFKNIDIYEGENSFWAHEGKILTPFNKFIQL